MPGSNHRVPSIVLMATFLASCGASAIDLEIPHISTDQVTPTANNFVSHSVAASLSVGGSQQSVDRYEWTVSDSSGKPIPVNSASRIMEWVPGTAGRYVVRVKVSVGNKTVTQSEDVVVSDGAPTFFATTVPAGTKLSWPTSTASLKRFYTVTSTQPGGSPQNITIGDPSIGTQVVPGLISGATLLLTIADASGTFFYTAAATVQDDADGNGCTSAVATLATSGGTCTVAAGATVTIHVPICSKCTDSNPSCQSEFVHDHVELAPVVQQCQADAGCSVNGCNINVPTVPCTVVLPAGLTTIPMLIGGTVSGTLVLGGFDTSCTL